MQEYNDSIILFSAISIYVSPLTSVLRSNECQQALFTFHFIIIAKSPIKGYKVVYQSEQGKDPNNNDHKHLGIFEFSNLKSRNAEACFD
ncbi:hypothetical protein T09_3570 [Trichinella sp. T9]|nr:hypothetical protein T09_3570 [Trichinella sp. T9]